MYLAAWSPEDFPSCLVPLPRIAARLVLVERRRDRAGHAGRREIQPHLPAEILREPLLDQSRAEPALARRLDRRPAALHPSQDQRRPLAFDRPPQVHVT